MSSFITKTGKNIAAISAFTQARWTRRFSDRRGLERYQSRAIREFLHDITRNIPFYAALQGKDLASFPVMTKERLRENFKHLNRFQVSLEEAQQLALHAEHSRDFSATLPNGISVGLSSGTSGQRGIFLVSPEEQSRWAGTVIAKVLSTRLTRQLLNPFAPPLQVMLLLRASNNLYAATTSRRLRFHYGDLTRPIAEIIQQLNEARPDVLVAPPSVLRQLAVQVDTGVLEITPRQVISAAEVLEPDDRALIFAAWQIEPGEIYQCTEGFLGCTCEAGRIHLNEELLHIEPQWLDRNKTRFTPLVTDFTRRTQAFVRYRLDDVLVDDPRPCPCGRVTRVIKAIEGRQDDTLWLIPRSGKGELVAIFPDLIRRAFMLAIGDTGDYRLRQSGNTWHIATEREDLPAHVTQLLRQEIDALASQAGGNPPAIAWETWTTQPLVHKRRRIQCLLKPAAQGEKP